MRQKEERKVKLTELKVQSFVTDINNGNSNTIKGGTGKGGDTPHPRSLIDICDSDVILTCSDPVLPSVNVCIMDDYQ